MSMFVKGRAYEAIPALEGARRRMVVCVGRNGRRIQLAWIGDLTVEDAKMCEAREIVQPKRPDGVYTVSSAAPLDIQTAAHVIDLILSIEAV